MNDIDELIKQKTIELRRDLEYSYGLMLGIPDFKFSDEPFELSDEDTDFLCN